MKTPKPQPAEPATNPDDVLRRMLTTPHKPHEKPKPEKKPLPRTGQTK